MVTYIKGGTTFTSVSKSTTWTEMVDAGTTVTVSSPQATINGVSGTQYVFDSYSPSSSVTMNSAQTITLQYKTQYQVTFAQSGSAVQPRVTYTANTDPTTSTPFSIWVKAGSSLAFSYQTTVSGSSGTQYVLTGVNPSSPQTVSGALTITATYKTQYMLTMATNTGTVNPASGWYDAQSVITISANAPSIVTGEQYVWKGWTGTGTVSYSGMTSSPSVTMNSPVTETASWTHQYYLTIVSAHGTKIGQGWYNAGDKAQASVSGSPVAGTAGTQYVFSNWSGDAHGNGLTSNNIMMNGPKIAVANWETQYYLTVTSPYSTTSGQGWYDAGTKVDASVAGSPVAGPTGTRYVFTQWSGDASGSGLTSNDITMNAPKTATAVWKTQYQVTFAQSGVGSDFTGTVVKVDSSNYDRSGVSLWLDAASSHSFAFQSPLVVNSNGKRYTWSSTSGLSAAQSGSITVSSSGSVTGNYKSSTSAAVWTDKTHYTPGATVVIYGSGLPARTILVIQILTPHGTTWLIVWTDAKGAFTQNYKLPTNGATGTYTVQVINLSTQVLATTTFTV